MIENFFQLWQDTGMSLGILQTLYMVAGSTLIAYLLGTPLGILLVILDKAGLWPHPKTHYVLQTVTNLLRSIPFLIFLVLMIPVTRLIVGTSIGSTAMIVPLAIAATAFVARVIENSLREVDQAIIEYALCMGAHPLEIIRTVYLEESLPSIIRGLSLTIISLTGYSAMAGTVAGGGLGDIAIRYGYYRYDEQVMMITVVLLIILVEVIQHSLAFVAKKIDKRLR